MLCTHTRLLAAALLSFCGTAHAQHVALWAGGGLGTFLSGGAGVGDPNAHRTAGVSVSLAGDRLELRALKGTLERPRGIPVNAGDDDFDYVGFDALIARRTTGLPVDVALGAARYEEVYHLGYPQRDLGGRTLVHRWGPFASALRSLGVARFGQVWVETDLTWPNRATPSDRSADANGPQRSEEHTSELQSPDHLVCRLLPEKKKY